ncbi:MAG: MoaD/ThiS family protein [Acidimicrobiales bacterium]|nr:MoaD/ThiS family protein [Acidimicrobiales bacterium]
MAVLRLFAAARTAAGTSRVEIPGQSVDEVVNAAVARFGDEFESVVETCAIWLNGEPAPLSTAVSATDEVALLPPVSGGEQ